RELNDPLRNGIQFDWFHFSDGLHQKLPAAQKNTFWNLVNSTAEETPIMLENVASWSRETHVFERGSWLSPGEKVQAGVPASLGGLTGKLPQNRLGLARWMTHENHPLTSR